MLKGALAASVTPLRDAGGELDEDAFGPLVEFFVAADLDGLLATLRSEGVRVDPKLEDTRYGRFGWITDPEGNRIELWEPPKAYRAPEDENPME